MPDNRKFRAGPLLNIARAFKLNGNLDPKAIASRAKPYRGAPLHLRTDTIHVNIR